MENATRLNPLQRSLAEKIKLIIAAIEIKLFS